ncbi:hypothetical protein, partial [Tahibacter caeni]|uniref:hypothetical protein n=1 Tax=Tahibacter caeni TaxID=1453545 RepID=UPI00214993DC
MSIRLHLPLPYEPAPPIIAAQLAVAPAAADLAGAARWCYELRYLHEHRAQDEIEIAVSFNVRAAAAADAGPAGFDERVVARLVYGDDDEIRSLRLRRTTPSTHWPRAGHVTPAGERIDLGDGVGDGDERDYPIDPPLPAAGWQALSLRWCGLTVADAQNARAALTAVRNRGLVDDASDIPVYRTATVVAADTVAPLNQWSQDFEIGAPGENLEGALVAAFGVLFGARAIGQPLALRLYYAYALAADDPADALLGVLPVALQPPQPLAATTAAEIAARLAGWQAQNQPPSLRARWQIELVQYAQIGTDVPRPLLDLRRLVYRLR